MSDFAVIVDLDDDLDQDAPASAIARAAAAAERAGVTAVSFDDHPTRTRPGAAFGRADAVLRAASVAPLTGAIGLIPLAHALYNEPFHLATQLATLDTASLGRAGWIAAADPDPSIAARHGRDPLAADAADDELAQVVEAIRRVWDTWEDDAVIRDAATGRYFDRAKVHYADFAGDRFSVKGPSILPRSPQGQPVVFGPVGTSAEVDAVLTAPFGAFGARGSVDRASTNDAAARNAGPTPDDLPELIARATEAADAARARHDAGTLVVLAVPFTLEHPQNAATVIELLARLTGVADGVRLLPARLDRDLDELGRAVLPELRRRGVFRSPRVGDTLRTTLGLDRPANRFASVSAGSVSADSGSTDSVTSTRDLEVTR